MSHSDYELDTTLALSSSVPLDPSKFAFKFYKINKDILFAKITISSTLYSLYYFSTASKHSIKANGLGTINYNIVPSTVIPFGFTASVVTIAGNTLGFDPTV